ENAFRDTNIAFANELSIICDKVDIDVWELIRLANRHPRVNILQPGPGVGGHCIAVDPWFIVSETPEEARLIRTAREVNDGKPEWVINKIKLAVAELLQANPDKTAKELTIACYGVAFKPDIDDLRESPALEIVKNIMNDHPGNVLVVEPNIQSLPDVLNEARKVDYETAWERAEVHVMLVDHKSFKGKEMNVSEKKVYIDLRGVW
ncbi:MAG: UDP binding domain-containing protein, partial [Pseudomonadales bacterium]